MKQRPVASLLLAIPLALLAQPATAKENMRELLKELTSQVKELKSQLQQSNARINQLEKERQHPPATQPPSALAATASSSAPATVSSNPPVTTATTSVTTASTASGTTDAGKTEKPPVTLGDVKGTFKIPGTDTSLGFGGYVKTDVIYNSVSAGRDKQGDQQTLYAQIPLERAPGEHSQVTFHAKESRLWFRSFTPSSWGDINTYLEIDFFGDPAAYTYTPRLRHAYGSIGNFLAGQTWTSFLNVGVLPDLLDVGGTAGALTAFRQPQIRWTQPFNLANTPMEFQVAVESPRSRIRSTPSADADSFSTPNAERYPDLIARLNFNPDWGNLSVAAMGRQIRNTDPTTGRAEQAWGGAVSVAGKINVVEQDNIRFMLNYGNALGRYATLNTFEDAALNSSGNMELLKVFAAMFSYQHFWSKTWRSTVAYGFAHAEQPDFAGANMTRQVQSVHANLLWSPISQTTFGAEYIYMRRDSVDRRDGDVQRVQFSARYNF